jgi:hypothetical protein
MAWHRTSRRVSGALLGVSLLAGGCTLVTDVSDFERGDAAVDAAGDADVGPQCANESDAQRDMALRLTNFSPHVNHDVEIRVVTTTEPPIQLALARLLPLDSAETLIEMPGAIPPGSHQLDFYADMDGSGDYTPTPEGETFLNHSWTIEPCVPEAEFAHNFVFQHLAPPNLVGEGARIRFANVPVRDVRLEVRVIEESTEATVGLARLPETVSENFEIHIDGIIDAGLHYRVAFYVDLNGNGAYDPPPVDEAFEITGITGGVDVTFDHAEATVTDVGF